MTFAFSLAGFDRTIAVIRDIEGRAFKAGVTGLEAATQLGATTVKSYQGGRPGPRAITGDFRRATIGETQVSGNQAAGQIGNNSAQALRLEYGFRGRDRLGRNYNQPPYPSFTPAAPKVISDGLEQVRATIERAF